MLDVARDLLCLAHITDVHRLGFVRLGRLGFARFIGAEGLELLLFADDARALLKGNLAAEHIEIERRSLGVLRFSLCVLGVLRRRCRNSVSFFLDGWCGVAEVGCSALYSQPRRSG